MSMTPSLALMGASDGKDDAEVSDSDRENGTDQNRLTGYDRRRLVVLLADAARHHRRHAHAQADNDSVKNCNQRLGDADRRDGVGAEPGNERDIDDGEHGLHRHFQHHRYGQKTERAAYRPDRKVGLVIAERFLNERPRARP